MSAILVVKLGALGDFVQATGPMRAIRAHHPGARLDLLTTAPLLPLARALGLFDGIILDDRPPLWRVDRWFGLRARLRAGAYDRVYDLQTSDRSGWYFRLMRRDGGPEWSGIAAGCSHPHANPRRDHMHTIDRQADQLAMAGIATVPPPDLSGLVPPALGLPAGTVLMVPGGAAHRPAKRWPHFAELAGRLAAAGRRCVVLGGPGDPAIAGAIDRRGTTSLLDLVALGQSAAAAVGNDTGPMHVLAAAGCPSLVLFSAASDPALCAPRGRHVAVLRQAVLAELPVAAVEAALARLLDPPHPAAPAMDEYRRE
ncbi:MAG: glycosyltransferase family 9 protein [Thalassobaculales bacterium]